jgi:hypothetical protein
MTGAARFPLGASVEWVDSECLVAACGLPVLTYATSGAVDRPLVVFLPGGGHLARIAYGHPASMRDEFLANWLSKRGFGVLAISYPGKHPIFPDAHPELTPLQRGAAAAAATVAHIARHGLSNGVILCVWSMAGRSVFPFAMAATGAGLNVELCVALAASAPLPGLVAGADEPLADDGAWDISTAEPGAVPRVQRFLDELATRPGAPITPDEYRAQYLNPHGVALRGEPQRWGAEGAYRDSLAAQAQTFSMQIQSHASGLRPAARAALRDLVQSLPSSMVRYVQGGHLFFVGRAGARQTAEHVESLWHTATALTRQVRELTPC